jgi:hypothetical protein
MPAPDVFEHEVPTWRIIPRTVTGERNHSQFMSVLFIYTWDKSPEVLGTYDH